jgi:hypothetical protein
MAAARAPSRAICRTMSERARAASATAMASAPSGAPYTGKRPSARHAASALKRATPDVIFSAMSGMFLNAQSAVAGIDDPR